MAKKCANLRGPGNNTKRSQIAVVVNCIALSLGRLRARLLELSVQSLVETSGTFVTRLPEVGRIITGSRYILLLKRPPSGKNWGIER